MGKTTPLSGSQSGMKQRSISAFFAAKPKATPSSANAIQGEADGDGGGDGGYVYQNLNQYSPNIVQAMQLLSRIRLYSSASVHHQAM
jgi:hypothetical protein